MKTLLFTVALIATGAPMPASAQPARPPAGAASLPLATDAAAPVPPLRHDSAFTGYVRQKDAPSADWREVNRSVGQAGQAGTEHAGHGDQAAPDHHGHDMKSSGHDAHHGHGAHK